MSKWQITSDGSVGTSGLGGCACILRCGERRVKLASCFQGLTSVQAELFGGLLGIAFVLLQEAKEPSPRVVVSWSCDSQTVVEKAARRLLSDESAAIDSNSLWCLFDYYAGKCTIQPDFIPSKINDAQQRACDRASRWAQRRGVRLIAESAAGRIGRNATLSPQHAWYIIDAGDLLRSLALDGPDSAAAAAAEALAGY